MIKGVMIKGVMIKLDREQMISLGTLAALLTALFITMMVGLQMRADAAQELGERNDLLSHLEARAKSMRDARARSGAVAPPTAFLDAPTQGLAGSALQAHILQMANANHATLISTGIEAAKREDPPDSIRLQATLDMNMQALQALLYQLESGTPYVYVGSLAVQLLGAKSEHAEDPLLRISLGLRAIWRRAGT
jgi:general secretion pathway protein M